MKLSFAMRAILFVGVLIGSMAAIPDPTPDQIKTILAGAKDHFAMKAQRTVPQQQGDILALLSLGSHVRDAEGMLFDLLHESDARAAEIGGVLALAGDAETARINQAVTSGQISRATADETIYSLRQMLSARKDMDSPLPATRLRGFQIAAGRSQLAPEELIPLLGDPQPIMRAVGLMAAAAAYQRGELPDDVTKAALKLLDDAIPPVRLNAIQFAASLKPPPDLESAYLSMRYEVPAQREFESWFKDNSWKQPASASALIADLQRPEPNIRSAAIRLLGKCMALPEEVIPALAIAADDRDANVRYAAQEQVQKLLTQFLGPQSPVNDRGSLTQALLKVLLDPNVKNDMFRIMYSPLIESQAGDADYVRLFHKAIYAVPGKRDVHSKAEADRSDPLFSKRFEEIFHGGDRALGDDFLAIALEAKRTYLFRDLLNSEQSQDRGRALAVLAKMEMKSVELYARQTDLEPGLLAALGDKDAALRDESLKLLLQDVHQGPSIGPCETAVLKGFSDEDGRVQSTALAFFQSNPWASEWLGNQAFRDAFVNLAREGSPSRQQLWKILSDGFTGDGSHGNGFVWLKNDPDLEGILTKAIDDSDREVQANALIVWRSLYSGRATPAELTRKNLVLALFAGLALLMLTAALWGQARCTVLPAVRSSTVPKLLLVASQLGVGTGIILVVGTLMAFVITFCLWGIPPADAFALFSLILAPQIFAGYALIAWSVAARRGVEQDRAMFFKLLVVELLYFGIGLVVRIYSMVTQELDSMVAYGIMLEILSVAGCVTSTLYMMRLWKLDGPARTNGQSSLAGANIPVLTKPTVAASQSHILRSQDPR